MPLSDQQIERYSRQIIVSGIGGIGQERLLGSRLMLAGSLADIESALAYMVGAGVGAIAIRSAECDSFARDALVDRMRRLNSDVTIHPAAEALGNISLTLALIGDSAQLEFARTLPDAGAPFIFTRLDAPARIALLPSRPPCPACADPALLAPFTRRAENAGFATMTAATIALTALASANPLASAPTLIEFDGYRAVTRTIAESVISARCSCRIRSAS
jgi:hypothetical protein